MTTSTFKSHPSVNRVRAGGHLFSKPHHILPGLNLHRGGIDEFTSSEDGLLKFSNPFPLKSTYPVPLLPPNRVGIPVLNKLDPSSELVKEKLISKKKMARLKTRGRRWYQEGGIYKDMIDKVPLDSNPNGALKGVLPAFVTKLALLLEDDPDPYFKGNYNWYYGNTVTAHKSKDEVLMLFSAAGKAMDEIYIRTVRSHAGFKTETSVSTDQMIKGSPIYEVSSLKKKKFLTIRQKNRCAFLKFDKSGNSMKTLLCVDSKVPFLGIDNSSFSKNEVCVVKANKIVQVWDIQNSVRGPKVSGKLPTDVHTPDNWCSLRYGSQPNELLITDRANVYLYDPRMDLTKPANQWSPSNQSEVCETISLLRPSIVSPVHCYIGTSHQIFSLDLRASFCQRWTHMMRNPPHIATSVRRGDMELLLFSSQFVPGVECIVNDWTSVDTPISRTFPKILPAISDTYQEAKLANVCNHPVVECRFDSCTTGLTAVKDDNSFILFTNTSSGDIFHQILTPAEKQDRSPSLTQAEVKTLKKFEKKCYKNFIKEDKTLHVTSEPVDVQTLVENLQRTSETPLSPQPKAVVEHNAAWQMPRDFLESCKDYLAPKLLEVWKINELPDWSIQPTPGKEVEVTSSWPKLIPIRVRKSKKTKKSKKSKEGEELESEEVMSEEQRDLLSLLCEQLKRQEGLKDKDESEEIMAGLFVDCVITEGEEKYPNEEQERVGVIDSASQKEEEGADAVEVIRKEKKKKKKKKKKHKTHDEESEETQEGRLDTRLDDKKPTGQEITNATFEFSRVLSPEFSQNAQIYPQESGLSGASSSEDRERVFDHRSGEARCKKLIQSDKGIKEENPDEMTESESGRKAKKKKKKKKDRKHAEDEEQRVVGSENDQENLGNPDPTPRKSRVLSSEQQLPLDKVPSEKLRIVSPKNVDISGISDLKSGAGWPGQVPQPVNEQGITDEVDDTSQNEEERMEKKHKKKKKKKHKKCDAESEIGTEEDEKNRKGLKNLEGQEELGSTSTAFEESQAVSSEFSQKIKRSPLKSGKSSGKASTQSSGVLISGLCFNPEEEQVQTHEMPMEREESTEIERKAKKKKKKKKKDLDHDGENENGPKDEEESAQPISNNSNEEPKNAYLTSKISEFHSQVPLKNDDVSAENLGIPSPKNPDDWQSSQKSKAQTAKKYPFTSTPAQVSKVQISQKSSSRNISSQNPDSNSLKHLPSPTRDMGPPLTFSPSYDGTISPDIFDVTYTIPDRLFNLPSHDSSTTSGFETDDTSKKRKKRLKKLNKSTAENPTSFAGKSQESQILDNSFSLLESVKKVLSPPKASEKKCLSANELVAKTAAEEFLGKEGNSFNLSFLDQNSQVEFLSPPATSTQAGPANSPILANLGHSVSPSFGSQTMATQVENLQAQGRLNEFDFSFSAGADSLGSRKRRNSEKSSEKSPKKIVRLSQTYTPGF